MAATFSRWKAADFEVREPRTSLKEVPRQLVQSLFIVWMFIGVPAGAAYLLMLQDMRMGALPEHRVGFGFYAGVFVALALLHSWAYLRFFTWRRR